MKILIIDTYYSNFLKSFSLDNKEIEDYSYSKHRDLLLEQSFGTSDFYSYNLKTLKHRAEDLIVNDWVLQSKWAKENGIALPRETLLSRLQMLPLVHRFLGKPLWIQKIALEQIKSFSPDVIYIQDLSVLNPETLAEAKKFCKLLVGQIACPLPSERNLLEFDLILTSFPHYVPLFKKMGINSEYFRIGFESRLLNKLPRQKRIYDVTFIGSFTPYHTEGSKLLELIAREVPINVWGHGIQYLSPSSSLRKLYRGEAWGLDMYNILAQSKIVINRHSSAAKHYANNMRLFEATGMGALLLTDYKKNTKDFFKIDKEIVEYKNSDDLISKIRFYLDNEDIRKQIALNGQRRTLKDHTYKMRIRELTLILERYL